MSFIVSINGQFAPYVYKIPVSSNKVPSTEPIKKVRDFDLALGFELEAARTQTSSEGLKSYQNQTKNFQREKKKIFARDIMSNPVVTLTHERTGHEAAQLMRERGFRHIVVTKLDQVIGMVNADKLIHENLSASLESLMDPKIIMGLDSARISDVAHLMLDEKLNALPILDLHQKLVGIITLTDILKMVVYLPEFSL